MADDLTIKKEKNKTKKSSALTKNEVKKEIKQLTKDLRTLSTALNKRSNQKYFEKNTRDKEKIINLIVELKDIQKEYEKLVSTTRKTRYYYLTEDARKYIDNNPINDDQPPIPKVVPRGLLLTWIYAFYKKVGVKKEEAESGKKKYFIDTDRDLRTIVGLSKIYYTQSQSVVSKFFIPKVFASEEEVDQESIDLFRQSIKKQENEDENNDEDAENNDKDDEDAENE